MFRLTKIVDVKQGLPRFARVIKILSRTGSRGGVQQVRVEFVEDTERTMVRNVRVFPFVPGMTNDRDL
jgi:ribosomal protein S28E/S33